MFPASARHVLSLRHPWQGKYLSELGFTAERGSSREAFDEESPVIRGEGAFG